MVDGKNDELKHLHLPEVRNSASTWPIMVFGAVILLAGIGIGIGGSMLHYENSKSSVDNTQTLSKQKELPRKIAKSISKKLDLDSEMEKKVLAILEERFRSIQQIRRDAGEKIQGEYKEWQESMKAILPVEKYEIWKKRLEEIQQKRQRHQQDMRTHDKRSKTHMYHKEQREFQQRLFSQFDADGNGGIEKEEVPDHLWSKIKKADEDKNGKITKKELKRAIAAKIIHVWGWNSNEGSFQHKKRRPSQQRDWSHERKPRPKPPLIEE